MTGIGLTLGHQRCHDPVSAVGCLHIGTRKVANGRRSRGRWNLADAVYPHHTTDEGMHFRYPYQPIRISKINGD